MAVISVSEQTFDNEVLKHQGYVLADFWAEWCMPCKRLMPIIEAVSIQNPSIKFVKVNVDENPNLSSTYNIRTIPTLILFKDGKQVQVKNGGAPAVELNQWLASNTK